MKKYLISSIVAAAVLCSCAQPKQQTGYRIDGEIAGVAGKVYLTVSKLRAVRWCGFSSKTAR